MTRAHLLGSLVMIGLSLAVAVFAYTRLIKESGPVVAVVVVTLRKVTTVALLYVVYPKVFSTIHGISALLVISGILFSSSSKQRKGN
jgi:drug/metabolite transporter (DMT)-like permease